MKDANAQTLFHLVPRNGLAEDSLRHPDNRHFVSNSLEGKSGLEIGFHVPAIAGGRIITRLGKNTDLILRGTGLSTVHVAFEMHPVTHVVLLSVRSRAVSSVETTHQPKDNPRPTTAIKIEGDCVIEYGESYLIAIALQEFKLVWSWHGKPDRLKELALQGYSNSLKRLEDVNSRYHPSDVDHSQYQSWYMTRIHSTNKLLVDEVGGTRVKIGGGAFGTVYKAIDSRSGNYFAVKEVDLSTERNRDVVRSHLHREIKALERLSHVGEARVSLLPALLPNNVAGQHHQAFGCQRLAHGQPTDLHAVDGRVPYGAVPARHRRGEEHEHLRRRAQSSFE